MLISRPETIDITNDKANAHRWLEEKGFATVRQSFPEEVLSEPETWEFPLIVKPRAGNPPGVSFEFTQESNWLSWQDRATPKA